MTFDSREQRGLTRRKLRFALLCSLFLHGVLLSLGLSRLTPQESTAALAPNRLIVRLRLAPVANAPAVRAVAAEPSHVGTHLTTSPQSLHRVLASVSPERQKPPGVKVPIPHLTAPALPMTSRVSSAEQAESIGSVRSPKASDMLVTTTNGQPSDQREVSQSDWQNVAPAAGLSADGLRRYRVELATQSRRFKRYPAQALAAGWAGTVEVFLAVDSSGQTVVTLNKSSGYEALDRAAQIMIQSGAQHTPVPDVLRGKAFSVVLPVVFDINEG
jgi:protein TonB